MSYSNYSQKSRLTFFHPQTSFKNNPVWSKNDDPGNPVHNHKDHICSLQTDRPKGHSFFMPFLILTIYRLLGEASEFEENVGL